MDKSTVFLTYLVLTLTVAICVTVVVYEELSPLYIEHQTLVNISTCLGIMIGVILSFNVHIIQQHFNKRKIRL